MNFKKIKASAVATVGLNGNNETFTQNSGEMSLSFDSLNNGTISISNTLVPIGVWIPRDLTLPIPEFTYVNATNITAAKSSPFIPNSIWIKQANSSIFVQIKPDDKDVGYIFLTKFESTPRFNSSFRDIDSIHFYCPSGK